MFDLKAFGPGHLNQFLERILFSCSFLNSKLAQGMKNAIANMKNENKI